MYLNYSKGYFEISTHPKNGVVNSADALNLIWEKYPVSLTLLDAKFLMNSLGDFWFLQDTGFSDELKWVNKIKNSITKEFQLI